MGPRPGIDEEEFKLLRRQPHLLVQFSFCAVFDVLVDLDGAAGISPFVIVGPFSEKNTSCPVDVDNACGALYHRSVADQFSHFSHISGHANQPLKARFNSVLIVPYAENLCK